MKVLPIFLLFPFLFLLPQAATAQASDSAALMQRLRDLKKTPAKTALPEAQALLDLPAIRQNRRLLTETFNLIGFLQMAQPRYKNAFDTFRVALMLAQTPDIVDTMLVSLILSNIGVVSGRMGDNTTEMASLEEAIELRAHLVGRDHESMGSLYVNLGGAYIRSERYPEAVAIYRRVIAQRERDLGLESERLIGPYNNMCLALKQMGNYTEAEFYARRSLQLVTKIRKPGHLDFASPTELLGSLADIAGDYERAIEYHRRALAIRLAQLGPDHDDTGISYYSLGVLLKRKGEFNQALSELEHAYAIYSQSLGASHQSSIECLTSIADCYAQLGRPQQAEATFLAILDTLIGVSGEKGQSVGGALIGLGAFYLKQQQTAGAESYFRRAQVVFKNLYGEQHIWPAEADWNLGLAFVQYNNPVLADSFFREALRALVFDPALPDFEHCLSPQLTYEPLLGLARDAAGRGDWPRAVQYFSLCQALNDYLRHRYTDQLAKDFLPKKELETSAALFEASFQKGKLRAGADKNLLFRASERCKSMALFESVREAGALRFSGLDDSLLARERELRSLALYYRDLQRELRQDGQAETDSALLALNEPLLAAEQAYESFKKELAQTSPAYFALKYSLGEASLRFVQDTLLQPDQTLVEYFSGDSALYILALRRDTFAIIPVTFTKENPLDSLVRRLRHGLTDYYIKNSKSTTYLKRTADEYTDAAFQLYQKLLAPVAGLLLDKVIVVPDGVLGYIPFDVLLARKPAESTRFYSHEYVGKTKQISYAYSATMLREMQDKKHKKTPGETLLALAPFFRGNADTLRAKIDSIALSENLASNNSASRSTITALPASGQEVKDISALFKGKSYYGAQSPKEILQNEAGNYRILHLSTHGQANDRVGDYAWLAFAVPGDTLAYDKFYVKDIYNLVLNADLVTLSACETGIGELKRGEGIISLARAFAYAGAKSIVTTLWSVRDDHTSELMSLFYQNLKNGMDKDTALWRAKKDFLIGQKRGSATHPYFWSGFIPVGDMHKIESH